MDDDLLHQTKRRRFSFSNIAEEDEESYGHSEQHRLIPLPTHSPSQNMSHHHHTVRVNRQSRRCTSAVMTVAAFSLLFLMLVYIPLSNHVNPQRIGKLKITKKTIYTSKFIL